MPFVIVTFIGFCLGRLAAGWAATMLVDMNNGELAKCSHCGTLVTGQRRWVTLRAVQCSCDGSVRIRWHSVSAVALSALFAGFTWLLLTMDCQSVHEVRPSGAMIFGRLPFHLTLIFLLWVATLTDLLDYVIPDEVIYAGIAVAVTAAFATGELQMIHIWVNWDEAIDGIKGPYLPEWMKQHQHLHGLAWSLAGLAAGAARALRLRLDPRLRGRQAVRGVRRSLSHLR